jgi:hypothetical protein
MDIPKLQTVQERMRTIINEEKPLTGFSDLAKATGMWKVLEEGSMDEPCVIEVGAATFVEDDESSMSLDDCSEDKLANEEERELDQLLDAIHGDDAVENIAQQFEPTDAQKLRMKKAILNIKADFLIQLRYGLWTDWSARIDKRMQELSNEIPGLEYLGWEELDHYVEIDGERYRMDHWHDHVLEQSGKDGKTVDELAAQETQ